MVSQPEPDSEISFSPPVRPKFHHHNTNDRLRESSSRPPSFSMISNIRKDRRSMFKELGLDTDGHTTYTNGIIDKEFAELTGLASASTDRTSESNSERAPRGDGRPQDAQSPRGINNNNNQDASPQSATSTGSKPWYSRLVTGRRPRIKTAASAPPPTMTTFTRLSSVALLIAVVLPGFSYYNGREKVPLNGADAGVINRNTMRPVLETRADSPTDVCKRWSQQDNNFLAVDLSKSWDVSSPAISAFPLPSGPPAVANGYLWNDYNSLYLYGGIFADNPYVDPAPISTWQYDIKSQKWIEHPNPKTSAGIKATEAGIPVQRAGEGAGISIPELGVSYYFGGHLDWATTPGWPKWTDRVYIKSLLEFTHPGYTNDAVASLAGGSGAGSDGVYRNITEGGLQVSDAFSERADGALVFVPGWGEKGILIGLAGGTNETFISDLSTLDVFDIANSVWYHQKTSGTPPGVRVNPCAVIASAPDASSFQIYLYGGQNLVPYQAQTQYSDMYILSIPSFTWVKAPQGGDNKPSGRAGHTCNLRDGQIVLVGGYTGQNTDCDKPGIYVFNASSLEWTSGFTALDHPSDLSPENSVLANSFGYKVPDVVASVIGGGPDGGATVTQPAVGKPSEGPFATGKSPVFTITASGSTATITQAAPGATGGPGATTGTTSDPSGSHSNPKGGLIAAGVIAGLAGLLALYLGYCAWLYRRQVRAYKTHLAVANRYSAAPGAQSRGSFRGLAAFFGRGGSKKAGPDATTYDASEPMSEKGAAAAGAGKFVHSSAERRGRATHRRDESTSTADSYGWVGSGNNKAVEPRLLFDDPTPDSGYASSPYGPGVGGSSSKVTPTSEPTPGSGRPPIRRSHSAGSSSSTEGLLDGQEPSFFSVVMGPRRALRVVNGLEGEEGVQRGNSGRSEKSYRRPNPVSQYQ
ncbi:hypothetical protein GE09DRAFT_1269550 [Coniochaeta sp. 2T2.1]|nr:hypothetical protein GE09DRAFT_1269550 [Coniochaeta sp. 2T2.1]